MPDETTDFTCPFCHAVSYNPNDALNRYCVRCHVFVDDVLNASETVRRAMARFHKKFAAVHPKQAAQSLRAAAAWEPKPYAGPARDGIEAHHGLNDIFPRDPYP